MKRIYFLCGLLTITTLAFSQATYVYPQRQHRHKPKAENPITFGIHAGINVSDITGKIEGNSGSTSSKVGFSGGVDVEFPVSPSFAIQPELNFSQMGGKDNDEGETFKISSNYLALPVLVKYTVPRSGFSVYIGPQIACLLHASMSEANVSVAATDYFNKPDFSGVFGVEYYFPCRFGISARYQVGFTNIAKNTADENIWGDNTSLKNNCFTVTLGYRF